MSVYVTLRVKADGSRLEEMAAADTSLFSSVSARGAEQGATYHRFYASDSEVLVFDEWPDEESFRKFFESSPEIADIMQNSGVTTQPEITFWRKLELGDDIG
jgi:heme-degrading monooxygenase HmoA